MAEMKEVRPSDISLGVPLPFSIYDKGGMLLLKAGFTINMQRQLDVLLKNGIYFSSVPEMAPKKSLGTLPKIQVEAQATFETLDLLKLRLQRLFEHYKLGRLREEFLKRIEDIALSMQEACTHDTDSALANLHLDYESPYAVVHHMQAAILCELIGKKMGVNDDARLTIIKAALTHDLGLLDIQDTLDRQTAPLTQGQKDRIQSHPGDSVRLLKELGVANDTWLDAVEHHHERLDGSGYQDGLSGEQIRIPTRVLAVADIYSAMVRDRPYRKAMVSKEAMRSLLLDQGGKTDPRLIQMMIKEVGVFPPGAIVRLINGEIGVVKQRQENTTYPIVFSFVRQDGMPIMTPLKRDTVKAEFNIDGIVPFSNYKGCITLIRGLWMCP